MGEIWTMRAPTQPRAHTRIVWIVLATLVLSIGFVPVAEAATGTISGVAYQDLNQDGVHQIDEPAWADHLLYLYDGDGNYIKNTRTGADGHYEFRRLSPGTYRVQYAHQTWSAIYDDWVPTTTGSTQPSIVVDLQDNGTADFGWRPIAWSPNIDEPMDEFVGPEGLRILTYNDVFSARFIYDTVQEGLVGDEAPHVVIRFAYGSDNITRVLVQGSNGIYTHYSAAVFATYRSWLTSRDYVLSHEYGHAWSLYHAYIVHQDPSLHSYLVARGLQDDSRVNSNYEWSASELIAEDYRQLLGSETARQYPQANKEIPAALDVDGLHEFLRDDFPRSSTPDSSSNPEDTIDEDSEDGTSEAGEDAALTTEPVREDFTGNLNGPRTAGTHTFAVSDGPATVTVQLDRVEPVTVRVADSAGVTLVESSGNGEVTLRFEVLAGDVTVTVTADRGKYVGTAEYQPGESEGQLDSPSGDGDKQPPGQQKRT